MRNVVFAAVLAAALSAFLGSCAKEEARVAKRPVMLRLSEVHAKGYPTSLADEEFARLVEERTEGRVIVEVRTGGTLSNNESDAIVALQNGDLAFTRVSAAPVAAFVPKLNAILLPYLYRNSDHMWKVLNGEIGQGMLDDLEKSGSGLIGLCYYDGGARNFYLNRAVHSVSDMEGLRIRVQTNPMMVDMCSMLGAVGVTGIGTDAVYGEILSGNIDGAENNWPTYESMGDYKAANCYIIDEHTRVPELLIASKVAMQRVSPEDLAIIKQVAKETCAFEIQKWSEKEKTSEQVIRANGNQVIELSSAAHDEFQRAMQPLYEKYGSSYSSIISAIRAVN